MQAPTAIKYVKPKILLVDLQGGTFNSLVDCGFNVRKGSFGQPYEVPMSSNFQQLISTIELPNYAEQEVVIVDLRYDLAGRPIGEPDRPEAEYGFWGKCDAGFIDPRVRAAARVKGDFNKLLGMGCVFVVFAAAKTGGLIQVARKRNYSYQPDRDCTFHEWSFLDALHSMVVARSDGEEMSAVDQSTSLGRLLKLHLPGSKYECLLKPQSFMENWTELAVNKRGESVALQFSPQGKGFVIVVPQLHDKTGFVKSLLTDVLPEMAPHLFPDIERGRWTHLDPYELPSVSQLNERRVQLEAQFKADSAALERQVADAREQDGWLHALLTQTGDPLVASIKRGLEELGFANVIDMDEVRDGEGKPRREDLQVRDTSPTLIIDAKGIAGIPVDEDVLQADKHATLLMREEKRTDVNGLSLINHQRNMPPLDRNNEMPFRQALVEVALEKQLGLLTTWDLFRLVRNKRAHGWKVDDVRPVLYRHGRVEIVPEHYVYVGKVTMLFRGAFGVLLEHGTIGTGDRLSVESPILFEEGDIQELQVEKAPVAQAEAGTGVGITWSNAGSKVKVGSRVFRVGP